MAAETFYEITPEQAASIGKFNIDAVNGIDPYSVKLTNGNYVIRVDDVNACADMDEIKTVDFTGKVAKTVDQFTFEEPEPPEDPEE